MANSPQARKRARQNDARRAQQAGQRSAMRTAIKKFRALISAGDAEAAAAQYPSTVSAIDRGVTKGLIKKNTASRYKSRLNNALRALRSAA